MNTKLDKLKDTFTKKNKVLQKKTIEYETYSNEVLSIKNLIDFVEGSVTIKPQILLNQGRDKKYIYGQMYYQNHPQKPNKVSIRFLIGKMDENKSKPELENKCREVFYDKYISGWLK